MRRHQKDKITRCHQQCFLIAESKGVHTLVKCRPWLEACNQRSFNSLTSWCYARRIPSTWRSNTVHRYRGIEKEVGNSADSKWRFKRETYGKYTLYIYWLDGTIAFLPDVRIYRQRGKRTKRNEKGSRAITPQVVERDDFRTIYPEHGNTWWLTKGAFDGCSFSFQKEKATRLFCTERS